MPDSDQGFLRAFYRALADRPLEPDEAWYVDLYTDRALSPFDPVDQLATGIEWAEAGSTHLLSGFRGSGKSTELRRLRARLQATGAFRAVLIDMIDTLDLAAPVDVADFLIGIAGAFGDALVDDPTLLGEGDDDGGPGRYWPRLVALLEGQGVELGVHGADGPAPAQLRARLRQDPAFRRRLRERLEGHLGSLVDDVHVFVSECVAALRRRHGPELRVALLLDSIEQFRGSTLSSAEGVYASVEALFSNHPERLALPDLHVVYTVPPWLKIRAPGVGGEYGSLQTLPCVRVRTRGGKPSAPGLDALERVVARRGDWRRVLGDRERLDRLILASGGYLRDLFRLLQGCLRHARGSTLPVDDDALDNALHEVRAGYLPLARRDARWLAAVARSHRAELEVHRGRGEGAHLYDLSRFFDTHMVLCYRDGEEWYDVHPLLREAVLRQADRAAR